MPRKILPLLLASFLFSQGCATLSGHDHKLWGKYGPEERWEKVLRFYADQDVDDLREWRQLGAKWEKARSGPAEERRKTDLEMWLVVERVRRKYFFDFMNHALLEEAIIEHRVHNWMTDRQVEISVGRPPLIRPPYDPKKDPRPDKETWVYKQEIEGVGGIPEFNLKSWVQLKKFNTDGKDHWVVVDHQGVGGVGEVIPGTFEPFRMKPKIQ